MIFQPVSSATLLVLLAAPSSNAFTTPSSHSSSSRANIKINMSYLDDISGTTQSAPVATNSFIGGYANNLEHAAPSREEAQQPAVDPASLERSSYGLGGFASSLSASAPAPTGTTFAPAGYAPVGGFGTTQSFTAPAAPAVQASIFSTPVVQGEASFVGGFSSALNSGATSINSGASPAAFGGHAASLASATDREVSDASSFVGGYAANVGAAPVQASFATYEAPPVVSSAGPTSFVGGFTSGLPSVNTLSSGAGMSALGGHANSLASANVILSKCGLGAIGGYSNALSNDDSASSISVSDDEYIDSALRSKLENAKSEINNALSTRLAAAKGEISTVLAAQLADTKKEIDSALKEKLSLAMFEMDSALTDKLAYAKSEMAKLSANGIPNIVAPAIANSGNDSAPGFLGGYLEQFDGASSSAKSALPVAINSNGSPIGNVVIDKDAEGIVINVNLN